MITEHWAMKSEESKAYGPPESEGEIDSVNQSFLYLVLQVLWKVAFIRCPLIGYYSFREDRNSFRECPRTIIPSIFLKSNGSHCLYYPSNIFGNVQNLLEDLKIGEYHSTGEYFTVVYGTFSDAIRQKCASENIWWIKWYI